MNKSKQRIKYYVADYFAALAAWLLFYSFRRIYLEDALGIGSKIFITHEAKFWFAVAGLPLLWLLFYYLLGQYNNLYRRSRVGELWYTLIASLLGVLVIFFFLILDDVVTGYTDYYTSFFVLLSLHFTLTWLLRFVLTSITKHKIKRGHIRFKTLIVGNTYECKLVLDEISNKKYGFQVIGCVLTSSKPKVFSENITCLGTYKDLGKIIRQYDAEEVIIAAESSDRDTINEILIQLRLHNVLIKALPTLSEQIAGRARMSFFMGTPLAVVEPDMMKDWQQNFKRIFDLMFSAFFLVLFLPFLPLVILGIKLTSSGPVFYKQERIGKHGNPFYIYKFRSMYTDAEKDGPRLSSGKDSRITIFGRFMRKYRVDEIPQFLNVLKGDMSVVGPRPERMYYIRQIEQRTSQYSLILTVKPGITSWGAVKYGYTENVEQMLEQLKYDLYYIQNRSLMLDFKILLFTISVVLGRKGK